MSGIERRVYIFDPKTTKPTEEDSYNGYVLALVGRYWESWPWQYVAEGYEQCKSWMQYPNLADHIKEFSYE